MNLWDKGETLDGFIHRFTIGDDTAYDMQLAPYDVIGSLAHARMLFECGLLTEEDWQQVDASLRGIYARVQDGTFTIAEDVEDVHTQVETLLTAETGDAGRRVHTARSRNDQVLVDIKLLYRDRLRGVAERTKALAESLLELSDRHAESAMPGYTHGQAAMPSSFGLWFAAHAECLVEDLLPLQTAYRMADRNPLGSAAGYGSAFSIDRDRTTALLGFASLHVNAINAQLGRGKTDRVVAQAAAAIGASLSRFAADVCMYVSQNYAFLRLRPEITTGSSIMPHKRNPDVFELLRAHCNRLQALPQEITLLGANLPSGYHRDFQLLKEIMLPALDRLDTCLDVARYAIDFLEIRDDILDDRQYDMVFTVDAIQQRVHRGIPFRSAYQQVAAEIKDGSFTPPPSSTSTHVGSPGNLCNDRIRAMLDEEYARFDFTRRDRALAELLSPLPPP